MAAFRKHYAELSDRSVDMPASHQIDVGHDLRCLSVMQHYEIPTRLLDWTADFWTALYFACSNNPGENAELWLYHRSVFEQQRQANPPRAALMDRAENPPAEPLLLDGLPIIIELDPQISPRMRQQFAHHTVSTQIFSDHAWLLRELDNEDAVVMESKKAPLLNALGTPVARRLENASSPEVNGGRVHRFLIDAACKGKVLQFLADTLHVNAGTIFPDVVGLGRFLRWQFDSQRTMMF